MSAEKGLRQELPKITRHFALHTSAWAFSLARAGFFSMSHLITLGGKQSGPVKTITFVRLRDLLCTIHDDAKRIAQNVYMKPWDQSLRVRELTPSFAIRTLRAAVGEVQAMAEAQKQKTKTVIPQRFNSSRSLGNGIPNGSVQYPEYYEYAFHFQPDGWQSTRSAISYDFLTETLFM